MSTDTITKSSDTPSIPPGAVADRSGALKRRVPRAHPLGAARRSKVTSNATTERSTWSEARRSSSTIDADSLNTKNALRDRHLRSSDFFDVRNHQEVRFESDAATLDGDTLKVRGRLYAAG